MMLAVSLAVYEIFVNQINCQKFDIENEGQGEGGKNGTVVRLEIFESI